MSKVRKMGRKLVVPVDKTLDYFDLTDLEGLALAVGFVGFVVLVLVSATLGVALLLLAVVLAVIAGIHFLGGGKSQNREPVTLIQIPAEPSAIEGDTTTWAAAVIQASDVGRTPIRLAQVVEWDDNSTEELNFRVLAGPQPGVLAVIGARAARLVKMTRQGDPEFQEVLL
ncbi:MAG TPA: hypothetical protein VMR75_03040 [Candidatus Saccharimonadales bacterium]|nr:hypothetical protein [Candidatus Saccharimonadales bacterium]